MSPRTSPTNRVHYHKGYKHIITPFEAHGHHKAHKRIKKRHWPRTIALIAAVFAMGAIIHFTIERVHLREAFQSAELTMAAIIDAVWGRVEEVAELR